MSSLQKPTRRVFMMQVAAAGAAAGFVSQAMAAAPAANMVSETDPTAVALMYHSVATKVDAKKAPKYKAGEHCGNCALYKGDAKMGDCPMFAGKKVAAGAWCTAYTPKA